MDGIQDISLRYTQSGLIDRVYTMRYLILLRVLVARKMV